MKKIRFVFLILVIALSLFFIPNVVNANDTNENEVVNAQSDEWMDFSNTKYELDVMNSSLIIKNVTGTLGVGEKLVWKVTNNKTEPSFDEEKSNYWLAYDESEKVYKVGNYAGENQSGFNQYLELSSDIYLWVEQVKDANTKKVVLSAKKIEKPVYSKKYDLYGSSTLMDSSGFLLNFSNIAVGKKTKRNFTIKVGKVGDNSILTKIKNNDNTGWSELLSFAKSNNGFYSKNAVLNNGETFNSENTYYTKENLEYLIDNMDESSYYYLYTVFDDENGKYCPIEGVTLAQPKVGYKQWNLIFMGSDNFIINVSDSENKTDVSTDKTTKETVETTPTVQETTPTVNIPDDAKVFNNHSYYIFDTSMTWAQAKKYCEDLGGHLVTITTNEEQEFIKQLIAEKYSQNKKFWIGASDTEVEGTWKWVTDEAFSYNNWGNGEPDNLYNQDFAIIQNYTISKTNYTIGDYQWDDIQDGESGVLFICEWETANLSAVPAQTIDATTANTILPKTGLKLTIFFVFAIVLFVGGYSYYKYDNLRGIK